MDDLPDVLDHLGKTPREVGALHLHVEPVQRGDDGRAVATLWCQAAYLPIAPAFVQVAGQVIPVPPLDQGRVMRGQVPLHVPLAGSLLFAIQCERGPNAKRVRPIWRLRDQIDKLEDDQEWEGSPGANLLLSNLASFPVGYVTVPLPGYGSEYEQREAEIRRLKSLPRGFTADVVAVAPPPLDTAQWEVVWSPGQPLPMPPPVAPVAPTVRAAVAVSGNRVCGSCGFSGRRADFATDRRCPSCGYEWD